MNKPVLYILIILSCSKGIIAQSGSQLSAEDKIYGLSVIWKEASYNFAFFDQIPSFSWDSCYQDYISSVTETHTDWEYYRVLEKFMAQLHDGHTRIFPPKQLRNRYFGTAKYSIRTRLIENKVIITDIPDTRLLERGVRKGMEIIAVNGKDVHDYAMEYVRPYVYAGTLQDLNLQTYTHFLLSGSTEETVEITISDFEGKVLSAEIARKPWIMEDEVFRGEPFTYRVIGDNIGYLQIQNFVQTPDFLSKFDSIYREILKTDGLVIDVRDNYGGATQMTHYVLKHLTRKNIGTVNWKSPKNIATHKAWGVKDNWHEAKGEEIEPFQDRPIYDNPVNVLADESSFSGAEDFCLGFRVIERGKIFGNKTAGSTGTPLMFSIFGDDLVLICTKRDVFPDGTEFIGYGIEPDLTVELEIDSVRKGTDRVLEAALNDLEVK